MLPEYHWQVSRKGLFLFLVAGFTWGIPYFFIAIAVDHFSTASVVWLRVAIGAAVLLPLAARSGALKQAWRAWPWVLAFAVIEMVVPWWLITEAEREISSGLVGLLITTVPFMSAFIMGLLGERWVWHPKTVAGLVIGFLGVIAMVGIDAVLGSINVWPVLMALGAAVGYSIAPIMTQRKISYVPTSGLISLSMLFVAIIYAPFALFTLPKDIAAEPPVEAWLAVLGLGVICSAIAFLAYFALLKEVDPTRASLVTYVNVAVAMLLGVTLLSEPVTAGILVGLPLVVAGSYLASRKREVFVTKTKRERLARASEALEGADSVVGVVTPGTPASDK